MPISNVTVPVIDPVRAEESNTAELLSVATIFYILAFVCVSLRFYARVIVVKSPGKDDVCIGLSAVGDPVSHT